jgi:diguanylate cyclase (GGDEF)-like protein/PAS domain S-box-containing protein
MESKWLIFAIILIINAITAFGMAVILLRRPARPGRNSMAFMLIGLGVWSFAYAMITLSPTLEGKTFWLKIENIGILSVPVHWFFFSLKYARLDAWLTRKPYQLLFWIIPSFSFALLLSGEWFNLYYSSVQMASETGGPLVISRGPAYWIAFTQAYVLTLGGMGYLLWRFIRSRHTYRRQMPYLIGAVLIPFIFNLIYQFNPGILPIFSAPVDLTPLSFNITAILLAMSIFGLRLFDLIPIARDTVLEYIPELVFVMDAHDRLIDANAMAQKWLGKSFKEIEGHDPIEVFKQWPQLLNRFFFTERSREEVEIPGNPPHTLEIVVTPIYNRLKNLEGRVIVARDITERKLLETKLRAVNQSLQEQLNENERLRMQLQEQAIRDPLTGVFNRRFFSASLDKETARAKRENSSYTILILDVDLFKKFNDSYGHKCGDIVLQSLASMLVENTRSGDIICRYGGEEFVILMTDLSPEMAYERAESLRKQFASMKIEFEGKLLSSTFSAGIACYPSHSANGEQLLTLADAALYQSKARGRNCTSVYWSESKPYVPAD